MRSTYHAKHEVHQGVLPSYAAEGLAHGCQLDWPKAPELGYEVLQYWSNSWANLVGLEPLLCCAEELQDPEVLHWLIISWHRLSFCCRLGGELLPG